MNSEISPHIRLIEPALSFHPDRPSDREIHPLRGLRRFGPYSAGLVPDPIRIATIAPASEGSRLYEFMKQLNSTFSPQERRTYLEEWPGFKNVFGVRMVAATNDCHIEMDEFDE